MDGSKNTTRTDTLVKDLTDIIKDNHKVNVLGSTGVIGVSQIKLMQDLVMYIQNRDHEIRIHTQNRLEDSFTLEAVRTDRLANAIFYRDKIDKIFEAEIKTYTPLVRKKWWKLW